MTTFDLVTVPARPLATVLAGPAPAARAPRAAVERTLAGTTYVVAPTSHHPLPHAA